MEGKKLQRLKREVLLEKETAMETNQCVSLFLSPSLRGCSSLPCCAPLNSTTLPPLCSSILRKASHLRTEVLPPLQDEVRELRELIQEQGHTVTVLREDMCAVFLCVFLSACLFSCCGSP